MFAVFNFLVNMKSFSTPPIAFSFAKIDPDTGILQKVVVAQAGKVKSYFEQIDATTLAQIESLGNAKEAGIKARFGHPNMCSSSFGTYIGRFKNFQIEGDKVFGDLHLDDVCKDSPTGNLFDYIVKMAKNNPDMFGASIAFVPAEPEITGAEYPSTRIEQLLATDLVDDPAATNSLFAVDSFSYQATQFLDTNPAIAQLIARKPDTIIEFMLKYYSNNQTMKKELFQKLKNLITPASDGADQDKVNQYNQTIEQLETDYQGQISTLEADHQKQLEARESEYQQQLSALNQQIATLQDQLSARPTTVEAADPQVKVGASEQSFGKQLLSQMPAHLKDKFKRSANS
jgi:flagellar biosynthesis chaperone FliJ